MSPDSYFFGTRLAKQCDYYAFPRTGSHYLWACFTGMFDLVFYPNDHIENPEARQRAEELNPHAYYVLRLREDGVPFQPIHFNASANGTHGLPKAGEWPLVVLIRDPHPTIYSWYHTAKDRWGANVTDRVEWLRAAYGHYRQFYAAAEKVRAAKPESLMLIRFEELKASPAPLEQLVNFLGVTPKLSPKFVHWWTDFERFTGPGQRTFYRGGNNEAWRGDAAWCADLERAAPGDFAEFGYSSRP